MHDLVPADHLLSILGEDLLQAAIEERLQPMIVFEPLLTNERLDVRVAVPLVAIDLVTTDVKVVVRKQCRHFGDKCLQKLISFITCWVH